jgi:hypothetical protein
VQYTINRTVESPNASKAFFFCEEIGLQRLCPIVIYELFTLMKGKHQQRLTEGCVRINTLFSKNYPRVLDN